MNCCPATTVVGEDRLKLGGQTLYVEKKDASHLTIACPVMIYAILMPNPLCHYSTCWLLTHYEHSCSLLFMYSIEGSSIFEVILISVQSRLLHSVFFFSLLNSISLLTVSIIGWASFCARAVIQTCAQFLCWLCNVPLVAYSNNPRDFVSMPVCTVNGDEDLWGK